MYKLTLRRLVSEPISSITATENLWRALEKRKFFDISAAIEAGANFASLNQSGLTPIQYAAQIRYWFGVIFLANQKNTDATDSYRYGDVLFDAIHAGEVEAAERLLIAQAPINKVLQSIQPSKHLKALFKAITQEHTETVKMLIAANASNVMQSTMINYRDHNGDTPLHLAIKMNNPNIVRLLLDHGADLKIKNNNDDTPFHYLVYFDAWNCLELCLRSQPYPKELQNLLFYTKALKNALDSSNINVFTRIFNARVNTIDEADDIKNFLNDQLTRRLDQPLQVFILFKNGVRFPSDFSSSFTCQNYEKNLKKLFCFLLVSNMANDAVCKSIAHDFKHDLYEMILLLSRTDPHHLGLALLEAAVDQSNGLGTVIHYQQGLYESKTAKKIYKEIEKRKKEIAQEENNQAPSQVASMQMWQQLPQPPEAKIVAKLESASNTNFTL